MMSCNRSWLVGCWLLLAASGCTQAPGGLGVVLEPFISPSPSAIARDAFNVYDADKRRDSVAQLAASHFGGEAPYLRLYRLLIDDPDPTVRAACIKALGMHGAVEDADLLKRYLGDPSPLARWEATKALQRVHSPSAVAPLIETMLDDDDTDVRMGAAGALGQYPESRVFHALVGALDDTDFGVTQTSRQSLHTLTGYDFGTDGSLWLIWAKKRSDTMFEHQQAYLWRPYTKPRGFWDKAKFWKKPHDPAPRLPTGLAATPVGEQQETATP